MTVTLDIPIKMLERVEHFAEICDTDVHALLLEAVSDYLDELEDIADAQVQRRRLKRGETHLIPNGGGARADARERGYAGARGRMTTFKVNYFAEALDDLDDVPARYRRRIMEKVKELATDPYPSRSKQ